MTVSQRQEGRLVLPSALKRFLAEPGDRGYAQASSTYTRHAHPAGVLFPSGSHDVAVALAAMRDRSLPLSIRSGGHGLSGRSSNSGGLVIDLSRLNEVDVIDSKRHLVRVGPGARWGAVADRLAAEGLAISSGDHGGVGVGGLATGGGIGWFARSYGLTIDHIHAVELITVDGQWLRLAAGDLSDDQADVFWALRGAGGGIGVATAFEVEAMTLEHIGVASLTYLVQPDGQSLAAWATAVSQSPRQLSAMATLMMYGDDLVLKVTAVITSGREEVIRDALAPLLAAGPARAEAQIAPYNALVSSAHQRTNTGRQAMTSTTAALHCMNQTTAQALVQVAQSPQRPVLQFRPLDGAVADVGADATAFPHRRHQLLVMGSIPGTDLDSTLAGAWEPITAHADGAYPGLESRADADTFGRAYPGRTGERIRALWRRFDPKGRIRPMPYDDSEDPRPASTAGSGR